MQYLISNPNTVSVSSSKKKKKDNIFLKIQLCIYLLDKCKGFSF